LSARLRAWGPVLLWAGIIFAISSQPTLPVSLGSGRDKLAHFAAYAVFGVLAGHALPPRRGFALLAILLGVAYGASDEIHQHFVPGRTVELGDWFADSLGVIAGVSLHRLQWSMRRARRSSEAHAVRS
jgi:VanZ family protein